MAYCKKAFHCCAILKDLPIPAFVSTDHWLMWKDILLLPSPFSSHMILPYHQVSLQTLWLNTHHPRKLIYTTCVFKPLPFLVTSLHVPHYVDTSFQAKLNPISRITYWSQLPPFFMEPWPTLPLLIWVNQDKIPLITVPMHFHEPWTCHSIPNLSHCSAIEINWHHYNFLLYILPSSPAECGDLKISFSTDKNSSPNAIPCVCIGSSILNSMAWTSEDAWSGPRRWRRKCPPGELSFEANSAPRASVSVLQESECDHCLPARICLRNQEGC